MDKEEILSIFHETGALISGHFLLASELHSDKYIQCAQVFQYPKYAMRLARALADKFRQDRISVVIGLATGSIILAHEVAKIAGARAIFVERDKETRKMILRRNFGLQTSDRILVVEDVITTGDSLREVVDLVRGQCHIIGTASVVNRAKGYLEIGPKYKYLTKLKINTFKEDKCPLCEKEIPIVKPGGQFTK